MFKILHIILISAVSVFGNVQTDKVTFLGVSASTLPERMSEQMNLPIGVHLSVDQVSPESPADSAGLKLFDILLKFDDQILVNSAQLKALVRMKNSGDQVNLEILRKGKPKVLSVILSEIDQSSIPNKPQLYGMRNNDIFTGDPFSSNIDNLIPNLDSSIRDLLESHGFSHLPGIKNRGLGFDPDSPLHGSIANTPSVQSFSFSTEQKQMSTSDEQGTLEYSLKNGQKHLRATAPEGDVIFDGPVTTEEDRKKLSPRLKKRLESFEKKFEHLKSFQKNF